MTIDYDFYYMNKEHGYLVPGYELHKDAIEMEYDDITDPTSVEYGNYELHYTKTFMYASLRE